MERGSRRNLSPPDDAHLTHAWLVRTCVSSKKQEKLVACNLEKSALVEIWLPLAQRSLLLG